MRRSKASLGSCRSRTVAAALVDTPTQSVDSALVYDDDNAMSKENDLETDKDSCPSCKIDLSSRTTASAAQHKRRCNAPPKQADGYECDVCKNKYKTYAGLRQHQRRAHIQHYNSGDLELRDKRLASSRSQYTDAEIKMIAHYEAKIPNRTNLLIKDIVKILADSSGRTLDGIKKLRLKETYKTYLAKEIEGVAKENARLACPLTPKVRLTRIEDLTSNICTQEQQLLAHQNANITNNEMSSISSNEVCCLLREIKEQTSDEMSHIIDAILSNTNSMDVTNMLDAYIRSIPKRNSSKNDKRHKSKNKNTNNRNSKRKQNYNSKNVKHNKEAYIKRTGNRSKRKSSEYARMQKLYDQNPGQVAEHILTGKELSVTQVPSMDKLTEYYKKLFSENELDWKPSKSNTHDKIDLSYPISPVEVHEQILKLKESASGIDGINRQMLRQMPRSDLHALLNIIWGMKIMPPILRLNRTTLLPKTGDLTEPTNWRPITISSRILRLLNKIIVTRLENEIRLSHAQRGFTKTDGIMANTTILQTLIKSNRLKSKPFTVLSIDLAKAFDSINIASIIEALNKRQIDEHTIEYIKSTYKDVVTILECHGYRSEPIPINRGVKQGDPMSGFLFNLVIDELLKKLSKCDGIEVNGAKLTTMAFADDIVVLAPNPKTMTNQIRVLENFFKKHRLQINIKKCAALQCFTVPGTKRLVVDTRPHLYINGDPVPTLGVASQFKYLGYNYAYCGVIMPSPSKLEGMLSNLKKSPLKPWQKLNMLQRYLIPRLHHGLQNMDINKKKLEYIDRCIVKFVKAILHLPITTPTPYIHAPLRRGGLGIPSLRLHISAVYLRRLERLCIRGDDETKMILRSPIVEQLRRRLRRILQSVNLATKQSVQQYWSDQLHDGALGAGLSLMSPGISSWIYNPPEHWKGRDYIGAIKLRIGLLPTKGAPYMSNTDCRNPSCAGTRESVYHILQRCPITHHIRINRHDNINKIVKTSLEKANVKTENAPRLTTKNDRYVPDIIALKDNLAYIIETTVAYETNNSSMNNAYKIKKQKYSTTDLIEKVKNIYNVPNVKVMPFVVGARGSWLNTNEQIVNEFKLSHNLKSIISSTALQWGVTIHRTFMSTVWRQNNSHMRARTNQRN
ncbi:Retrovirus-related Pol polyprotein from type-1 retrotransposable element R2 (Fragment) [Anthophora plagiata]